MLKPADTYLKEVSSALSRGGSMKMGLALYKSFQNVLATSTEQIIRINTGLLGSVNAIHLLDLLLLELLIPESLKLAMWLITTFNLILNVTHVISFYLHLVDIIWLFY